MRIIFVCILAISLIAATGHCEQKYNPHNNKWETVPDNSDWQTRYNPHENDWSYQPKDAKTEYNPFENKWEWDSGHNSEDED